jgi:spore coat protein CotH
LVCADQNVEIHPDMYSVDPSNKLILINENVDSLNLTWPGLKDKITINGEYTFNSPVEDLQIGTLYKIKKESDNVEFKLYFTQLPVIRITHEGQILDEPRISAQFKMVESNHTVLTSNIGIEYRGGWSQSLPKKSLRIEFWEDVKGITTRDVSLLGMRSDDDWNLQAMFNEPMRIRSKTNSALWLMIHKAYYLHSEPTAKNGFSMEYAEVFVNNRYRGVYAVSERVDRKQLQLKKPNGTQIRGELYQGKSWNANVTFGSGYSNYNNNSDIWGGQQYRYPEDIINWKNLYNFVRFVVTAPDDEFNEEYSTRFELGNAVDYYIFLNLLRATDNTGKNVFIAKYKENEPYFYVPWDLDGSFGTIWDGSKVNTVNDIMYNGMYKRMWNDGSENGFKEKVKQRWQELRYKIITQENLLAMFQKNFDYLYNNGVYEREKMAWTAFQLDEIEDQFDYMGNWIRRRLNFLDERFEYDPTWQPPVEESVTSVKKDDVKLYPNPVSDDLYIESGAYNDLNIRIYNSNGQLVLSSPIGKGENKLSVKGLKNGVYLVRIQNDQLNKVRKIIVQK